MSNKILIEYNGAIVPAFVIEDYKVCISQEDAGVAGKIAGPDTPIELDQCKSCGAWKSEDEALYDDGRSCDECS